MISTTVRPRVVRKGLICQVFIGLKEISDRRRADDQLIMKPFFFSLLEGKSAFIFEDGSESPPYPSLKTRAGFFLKRFNHHFSCLCGTSGFLAFVGGKWTQLSPQFTVWLWVDF